VEVNITYVQLDRDYVVTVVRDITARKKAEEMLKQSEEQYRKFFEDDLTADYVSTPDGRILACNPAFVRIFGFASMEEALNTNASTLGVNPEKRERFLSLLREKTKLEYYETEYIRRDGKRVYSVENAIGIFDAQGDLVQIRGYLFDDTKRKLLEEQLLQAQKLESLGTLAGGIAHDFNNILGIILGHSALMERLKGDPQKLSESIETITKATLRGAGLVKQLLTFARKTEALFETVSINDMIREINKLLKGIFPRTITVSTSLQQDLPTIVADAGQIHQVLLNLCVNARDAMPKGGTLSISVRTIEGESVSSRFARATARQYVQIEVADTGSGMDESTRQRIFEPFFTTKAPGKGTGLGLAVVFGVIENHNGFIDVRSAPGEGTGFTVFLPIPELAPEVSQRARKGVEEITGGTETILVIEDEEMLRNLAKGILVSKGYTVLTAEDGMQGVEMYQSHQKEIAVVLSDIGLPILSGQDVLKRIREVNPKAKVILASGFIDPETKSEMYKAGAKHFMQKPYSPGEVLQKIRELIDSNG
jgi:PAS domain S-box-containing protein